MSTARTTSRTASRLLGAAAALLVLATTACSGGAGGSGSASTAGRADSPADSSGVGGGSGYENAPLAATPQPARSGSARAGAGATTTSTAARILPTDRDVIYRGSITVRVKDIGAAADRVESLTLGVDGIVFAEQTSTDPRHPQYGDATMTVRVPPTAFGPTLDSIARLGRELGRQRSAEDVTGQVADTGSRLRTQQRSVDRVRALLSQADTIGDVVRIESELSRREADLESLEAQLKRLKDLTGLATVDVHLTSPAPVQHTTVQKKEDDSLGFLSGLRGGWDAFVAIVLVVLTVVGALVPFAVAVALVGVPLLLVWRSRRRTPAASAPPPA